MSTRQLPIENRDGRLCVTIQIGKNGSDKGVFFCYTESWEFFLEHGYPNTTTFSLVGGHVYFSDGKKRHSFARFIKQAPEDLEVTYLNGDKLDLRLSNLGTRARKGRARALPAAKVSQARQPWLIDADLIDSEKPDPRFEGGTLVRSSRKVDAWYDPAAAARAAYATDAAIAYLMNRRNKSDRLTLPGKTYAAFKAPALNKETCRWSPQNRKEEGK